jgi:hypothetical protein
MIVGFNIQTANADSQQAPPSGVGVHVGADVSGVDNLRETRQCWVSSETIGVDQGLERAPLATITRPRAGVFGSSRL